MGSELIDAGSVSKSKSSSGGKCFPPGFRFHPTDEELVLYYLKRKICRRSLKLNIIGEVDVYKWDPQELPGQSKLKTGDRQWFFFSPRDRKYPNGGRSSRATRNGYWKATGKDRVIKRRSSSVGVKKTLVYYQGRAPSGLRTDWVMHEYTMDEKELKRCPVAQEHYVLYKIFKKSGAGPKNGEQYGAPFVDEEWNDEDCLDVDSLLVQKPDSVPVPEFNNTNNGEEEGAGLTGLSDDIVEFLNKIIDEPEILPPEPEILEKNQSSLLEGSSSQVEKDFLEMDDLIGPETGVCNPVTDFDSLSEFDLYHDFGTRHIESQGAYNVDNLEYGPGPENVGLVSGAVNHDYELLDELPISYDLWNHYDQCNSSIMTSQTVLVPVCNPSSGVVIEENPVKPEYYQNQCPENTENNTESWFSSALWDFVDSIPTTPASASESSAVVNRAFERMSSFSRGRNVNLAAAAAVATSGNATKRLEKPNSSRSSRGIVYFSVLGVLFAMLWVFVGSCIDLLNRFVWL
ncbi:hypothetical protein L1987_79717 [Smallanthus sonchifolius]|uniref:Uncharacterized protein n=1 Tax=Smallanthus sonchifolius TaxID=185202 RepID=A0ACB8YJZ7_9ASTR|nr:hypothetical protein L1987_79717 [Smallanthus sonchifolius]